MPCQGSGGASKVFTDPMKTFKNPGNVIFFTSKEGQKKKRIGVHKSGMGGLGQRFMNSIHKIPFFLIDGFP